MARMLTALRRCTLVLFLLLLAPPWRGDAHAAGFLLNEQSGRALGSAFAGEGAVAMDPTTVYYNPAGLTLLEGGQIATSGFAIWTHSFFENRGSHLNEAVGGAPLTGGEGGNGGNIALVPTFFFSQKVTDRVSVGLGVSAPFGLETDWPRGWVGRYHARLSRLATYNFNPSIAVRATDWLSLGGGADYEYADATLTNNLDLGSICQIQGAKAGIPPAACTALGLSPQKVDGYVNLKGHNWAPGYNFGALFSPTSGTRIGLTYRSRIEHDVEGNATFGIPKKGQILRKISGALVDTPVSVTATLPDRAAISLFSQLTNQWAFLADMTWTHWALFKELDFKFGNPKQPSVTEPENWDNSERFSLGTVWTPNKLWSGRFGTAYDISPVPDREHRTPRIPDADRIWLTLGVGYRPTTRLRFDLSYGHIFLTRTSTRNRDPVSGAELVGNFRGFADLFAFQVTYNIDWTFTDVMGTSVSN